MDENRDMCVTRHNNYLRKLLPCNEGKEGYEVGL